MLLGILDLSGTGIEVPLTPRSDQRDVRCECLDRQLEADLVVALTRSAVSDGVSALFLGDLDELLRDDRTCERRAEQVLVLVDSTGLERRPDVFLEELFLEVLDVDLGSTGFQGLVVYGVELVTLSDIGADSDDFAAIVMLLEPRDDDGGIETARVCEYDFLDLSHDKNLFSYDSFPLPLSL